MHQRGSHQQGLTTLGKAVAVRARSVCRSRHRSRRSSLHDLVARLGCADILVIIDDWAMAPCTTPRNLRTTLSNALKRR